jgi:hypothetical protein
MSPPPFLWDQICSLFSLQANWDNYPNYVIFITLLLVANSYSYNTLSLFWVRDDLFASKELDEVITSKKTVHI